MKGLVAQSQADNQEREIVKDVLKYCLGQRQPGNGRMMDRPPNVYDLSVLYLCALGHTCSSVASLPYRILIGSVANTKEGEGKNHCWFLSSR